MTTPVFGLKTLGQITDTQGYFLIEISGYNNNVRVIGNSDIGANISAIVSRYYASTAYTNGYVLSVKETNKTTVKTDKKSYTANHVFDSRIAQDYYKSIKDYTNIVQHFKGWVIKTKKDIFDENSMTMMDYRLKDGNQTTFTYVLPFSKNEALIEFTYFTENIVNESIYDNYIKKYISDFLKIKSYEVIETEMGQIPMTNLDPIPHHQPNGFEPHPRG